MSAQTVVIIDDDAGIRNAIEQVLNFEGCSVVTAKDGQQGLEVLRTTKTPCLVLLDLMMPNMNGWEFLQAISMDKTLTAIPIVILTAFTDKANDIQANGVIQKPVNLDLLLKFVTQYCNCKKET